MRNLLKAKIGFQIGIKAGGIGGVAFVFIVALTYILEEQIAFADLLFQLIELFSLLLFVSMFGAIGGGLLGMLISLTMKTPRYAILIGMVIGIIAGGLYPTLLLILDGIYLRYLVFLVIGLITGAFAGRYGGRDFRTKWMKASQEDQVQHT